MSCFVFAAFLWEKKSNRLRKLPSPGLIAAVSLVLFFPRLFTFLCLPGLGVYTLERNAWVLLDGRGGGDGDLHMHDISVGGMAKTHCWMVHSVLGIDLCDMFHLLSTTMDNDWAPYLLETDPTERPSEMLKGSTFAYRRTDGILWGLGGAYSLSGILGEGVCFSFCVSRLPLSALSDFYPFR